MRDASYEPRDADPEGRRVTGAPRSCARVAVPYLTRTGAGRALFPLDAGRAVPDVVGDGYVRVHGAKLFSGRGPGSRLGPGFAVPVIHRPEMQDAVDVTARVDEARQLLGPIGECHPVRRLRKR